MSTPQLRWLGQAGFIIAGNSGRVVVDPFLSQFPGRLVSPPVQPEDLVGSLAVLVSHEHVDHMDLPTLRRLRELDPAIRVVLPHPLLELARSSGLAGPLIGAVPGQPIELAPGLTVHPVASRHGIHVGDAYTFGLEHAGGGYRYLGYVLDLDGYRIYHSGDTLDYPELADRLRELHTDAALLPINGRSAERESQDLVGNLSAAEAVDLAARSGVALLIPMHYEMFAGNRGPLGAFVELVREHLPDVTVHVPGTRDFTALPVGIASGTKDQLPLPDN
ncbi:MBL fold metallo-hydrolase [Paenarthrobacter sp. Z7-10]|uniref:MBL fold metallo-hydrolase n=1 Tax=Paenarthrobacter sp. Z7-10 TaxID=2787635 RepID=UPI0022A9E3CC|nr:MBL fold metallo-hydrolase [Paenarthrobacter sp. Z7-10]MCZ2404686.1 MBL fold metallo-hydrolase [Paenarthrobacter sp. Z7-10]